MVFTALHARIYPPTVIFFSIHQNYSFKNQLYTFRNFLYMERPTQFELLKKYIDEKICYKFSESLLALNHTCQFCGKHCENKYFLQYHIDSCKVKRWKESKDNKVGVYVIYT